MKRRQAKESFKLLRKKYITDPASMDYLGGIYIVIGGVDSLAGKI